MKLIDFHTHPLLKPANSSLNPNQLESIWKVFLEPETCVQLSKSIQKAIKSTDKCSQADFTKVTRGGVNGIFIAMGPAERPFFAPNVRNPLVRLVLPKTHYRLLARSVTGFCMEKINKIMDSIQDLNKPGGVDYFNNELLPEYQYILGQEKNTSAVNKFRIAKNYSDFKNIVDNEPGTIAVVLTVEGAHSFGNFLSRNDFTSTYDEVQQMSDVLLAEYKFIENIRKVKTEWKENTPLFVRSEEHTSELQSQR